MRALLVACASLVACVTLDEREFDSAVADAGGVSRLDGGVQTDVMGLQPARCGDGRLAPGEVCDDGNDAIDDGCQTCQVSPGYRCTGAPSVCSDINECQSDDPGANDCDVNATCTNSPGSFRCTCKEGYVGDGTSCAAATVLSVAAGGAYSCVLLSDGGVRCWGSGFNPLGYGNQVTFGDNEAPAAAGHVPLGEAAQRLSVGAYQICAILDMGRVRCWGSNLFPTLLGYGTAGGIGDDETPESIGDLPLGPVVGTVNQIAGSETETCILLSTGIVRCWGFGFSGDLGTGNTNDVSTAAAASNVSLGVAADQIAVGSSFVCALSDGNVRCWGNGQQGALGYGTTDSWGDDEAPSGAGNVVVGGQVQQLSAFGGHVCALLATGSVRCWGFGESGRLGYGSTLNVGDDETPATAGDVPVGGAVQQIAAGGSHTCALLTTGAVRCWGSGQSGQLGYGNTNDIGDDETPASVGDVPVGGPVRLLAAGREHTCAVLTSGGVRCWGAGSLGQLGQESTNNIGDDELPEALGDVIVL
jgi:cysteine-rich repeat protein